ncbi:hypothetical protein L596_000227 [Steinernema carpocapsae]|uniref:Uncharacterized protein n=1 Tax=Steinernema carpocapsae TaxID=34508 RepID=A0A4U8UIL4_STECR|nr:hypothetical protein L596_000227 [Steinernema carpocapsae]
MYTHINQRFGVCAQLSRGDEDGEGEAPLPALRDKANVSSPPLSTAPKLLTPSAPRGVPSIAKADLGNWD